MTEGWRGWDDYAPFYDWENARTLQRRDVPFWQRLAAAQDGPVLELGCGTGRIAVPAARAGARIVGIDRSAEMLARARTRIARARLGGRVALVRGDIRDLPFRSRVRFSAVLAAYGILQSLTRERDLARTFESVRRVLRRGGLFAIDVVPDLLKWEEVPQSRQSQGASGTQNDADARRNGAAGSPAAPHDLRPGISRSVGRSAPNAPLFADLPDPVGAADDAPARTRRLSCPGRAGGLSGRALGPTCRRVGHPRVKALTEGTEFTTEERRERRRTKNVYSLRKYPVFVRLPLLRFFVVNSVSFVASARRQARANCHA